VEIAIVKEQVPAGVAVHVHVKLSSREMNRLFLAGDTLIQLPLDGVAEESSASPLPRMNIFLSELAGAADGFTRTFTSEAHADEYARVVRAQIESSLEGA